MLPAVTHDYYKTGLNRDVRSDAPIPRKQQTEARNPVLSLRNRKFESISLQRGVRCELDPTASATCPICFVTTGLWSLPAKPTAGRLRAHLAAGSIAPAVGLVQSGVSRTDRTPTAWFSVRLAFVSFWLPGPPRP